MQKKELLDGTWEFIGKEIYLPPLKKWIDQEDYVEGLKWEFHPEFALDGVEKGMITESAPDVKSIEMAYIYDRYKQSLRVDVEIQDIYEVIPSQYGTAENPVIRLNILTGEFPAPYLRYILRKIG